MKKAICGIYAIKNLANGKVYVGQSRDVKKRWAWHKSHLNKGTHGNEHLQRAWNKYGETNFCFELVDVCEPFELDELERIWEKAYSKDTKTYNIAETGGGHTMSKEHREKISKALKGKFIGSSNPSYGRKFTEEQKRIASIKHSGKNCYWYGKKRSNETKEKLRIANLGKKYSEESKAKKSKPVLQYDKNMVFLKKWKSMHDVQYTIGIRNSSVSQACKKGYKAGGYYWRLAE